MALYFRSHHELPGEVEMIKEAFSMESLTNLFFFVAFFFTVAPFFVYIFAMVKLLDEETQFWKLFSALGYSYISYIPAILLTLLYVGTLKWLFIALACTNQIICLEKQSRDLVPRLKQNKQEQDPEEFQQLQSILRGSFLLSQICFALVLKVGFVH